MLIFFNDGRNLVNLYLNTENNQVFVTKTKRKVKTQDRYHKRKLSRRNRNQPSIKYEDVNLLLPSINVLILIKHLRCFE